MADNDLGGMDLGEGALTQEQLDALLAAADAEGADPGGPETWPDTASVAADETQEPGADVGDEILGVPSPARSVVDLPSFGTPGAGGAFSSALPSGMGRVRDIPLEVTVELGRTRLLIRDILDLGTGSIIELDKIAGEPVDLLANGLLLARGEVVVIEDNFGVRVTEIITASDRSQMKEAESLAA